MAKRLTRLRVHEISAVDRGAGEGVRIILRKRYGEGQMGKKAEAAITKYLARNLFTEAEAQAKAEKREFSGKERRRLAGTGAALPDGCLSADTMVETLEGPRAIGDLVGRCVLLTDQGWRNAEVRCFGVQSLSEVTVSRAGHLKQILVTSGHRWYTERGEILTAALARGDSIPHVARDRFEPKLLEPAEQAVATMAEQPANTAGLMVMIDHERRPLAARTCVSAPPIWNSAANSAASPLDLEHGEKFGVPNAVFSTQHAFAAREPALISNLNFHTGFAGMPALAGPAFGSVAAATDIKFGDGLGVAAKAASEEIDSSDEWGNGTRHCFPYYAPAWLVEQVRATDLVEPVFCAIVPKLHRFVIAGGVLTGNSFPIANEQDLKNAIRAIGRASDPGRARAHIMSRARSLGLTRLIPTGWSGRKAKKALKKSFGRFLESVGIDKAIDFNGAQANQEAREYADGMMCEVREAVCSLEAAVCSIMCDDTVTDKQKAVEATFKQFHTHLTGIVPEGIEQALQAAQILASGARVNAQGAVVGKRRKGAPMDPKDQARIEQLDAKVARQKERRKEAEAERDEAQKQVKALKKRAEAAEARLGAVMKLSPDERAWLDHPDNTLTAEERIAFIDASPEKRAKRMAEFTPEQMLEKRLAGLPEAVRKDLIAGREAQAEVVKQREAGELAAFTKRATDLGLPETMGPHLHALSKHAPDALKEFERLFKAMNEQQRTNVIFKDFGTNHGGDAGSATARMEVRTTELMKADPKIDSVEKAVAKVAISLIPADQELWREYKAEKANVRDVA